MARRTTTGNLHPKANERIQRMRIETLRKEGRYRELVLWLLGESEPWQPEANAVSETRVVRVPPMRWMEPTPDDLAGCLREESSDPLPVPIREYIISRYVLQTAPRKTGPLHAARSTDDDNRVVNFYVHALFDALDAHEANEGPETRAWKGHAAKRTAKKFDISVSTLESILTARRLFKSTK